ncbi:MAG: cobalt-precorrin-5B (C(1))-methyltransferase [Rhodospirillales bacterium]|nr:cobalt-precorrin-5B (C(1))-methyltransferase [Rhodospirillales bacterium]
MKDRKPDSVLRKGWTTGACATAATAAAFRALITGAFAATVRITLPKGQTPQFSLCQQLLRDGYAQASIIKDAGDDPDVTHGAEIVVRVRLAKPATGVRFVAGEGVGTVTLPGLPLAVGEPAINPGPRRMIEAAVSAIAAELSVPGDVEVTISIPDGERLALKTMNGRLGIRGGLSVLGTTGIVIPYSCSSWIHSIHRGVDVAKAAGISHMAAATGSTSEAAVAKHYGLADQALIDMGDFAGGLLKYLRKQPIERLTLAGGFGKLSKLAQGHLDLHSSRSRLDLDDMAARAQVAGADAALCARIKAANTGLEALTHCQAANLPIADIMAAGAREVAMATLSGGTRVEVLIYDREGQLVGHADG